MKRWRLAVAVLAALAAIAAAVLLGALRFVLAPADPAGEEVIFAVAPGQSVAAVAAGLEKAGLVRDARAVRGLARWHELEDRLQVGEFALSSALTPREILEKIVSGKVVVYEVTLPEGFSLVQIAERLAEAQLVERDAFLEVARDPATTEKLGVEGSTLEGYLYPETYRLPKGLTPLEVARVLVDQFLAVWVELEPLTSPLKFSMQQVVTLASIIEKETGAPDERPLIASVFLNRLRRGMRLETDPTVIYGIEDFDGNLRRRHLEDESNPYNTYQFRGLPPGPIANPGRAALFAVAQPADTNYLFFVSRNNGTHVFSESYRDHSAAVERYQRRGKSSR